MSIYNDQNITISLLKFLQLLNIAYDNCSDFIDNLEDDIVYNEKMWADIMSDRFR